MNKATVVRGRGPAPQRWGWVIAAGVLMALVAGALGWAATWRAGSGAATVTAVPATAPQLAVEGAADGEVAMSPRALAQYRAFYAQQMASEAALESWSAPVREPFSPETAQPPRQIVKGVQFE